MKKPDRLRWLSLSAIGLVGAVALYWAQVPRTPPAAETVGAAPEPAAAPPALASIPAAPVIEPAVIPSTPLPSGAKSIAKFRDWADSFTAATGDRSELLEEGIELAHARRERMLELMRENPQAAWEAALPYRLRQQLPPSVQALLEERVDARGDLLVLGVVPGPTSKVGQSIRRHVDIKGQLYTAHVFGRRLNQITTHSVALHGLAIGEDMVVHPDTVRVLEPEEVQPLLAAQGGGGSDCGLCTEDVQSKGTPIWGLAAQKVYAFCCAADLRGLNDRFARAEAQLAGIGEGDFPTNPPPDSEVTFTQGRRTVLYIRLAFQDDVREPISESAANAVMNRVNDFFVENSYNTLSLVTTVTPLFILPQTERWYSIAGPFALLSDGREVARQAGYPFFEWDLDIVAFNTVTNFDFGGLAFVGARGAWLQSYGLGVTAHELGHNLGLLHANFWDTFPPPGPPNPNAPGPNFPVDSDSWLGHEAINGPGGELEYGDIYDTMGSGGGAQFNTVNKYIMGWLREPYVRHVVGSETNRLFSFDTTDLVEGRAYSLRVRKDFERDYWIDFREQFPNNPWMVNGIELHWPRWPGNSGHSQLLDTTPGTADDRDDAAVVIGRTYTDEEVPVHITPVEKGGFQGQQWIDVVVHRGVFPTNQPPTLLLTSSAQFVNPGVRVDFTALSTDVNGDRLAYYWEFSDRTFANGPTASKTFPAQGWFVARCEVSDMKGGVTSDHAVIRVGNPTNFTMSGRVLDTFGQPLRGLRMHNGFSNSVARPDVYRWTQTDSQGEWTLTDLVSGTYTNRGFLYGYKTEPLDFSNPVLINGANAFNLNHLANPRIRVGISAEENAQEGGAAGRFLVSRTGPTTDPLEVFYVTSGSAQPGTHYEALPSLLTIPAGSDSAELLVTPTENMVGDGLRDLTVTLRLATNFVRIFNVTTNTGTNIEVITMTNDLTYPGWDLLNVNQQPIWFRTDPIYVLDIAEATLSVEDNDPPDTPMVSFSVIDDAAVESGEDQAIVLVSRMGNTTGDLVVLYGTGGFAENGLDFYELPGTITIPDGQDFVLLRIVAREDQFVEGNEELVLTPFPGPGYTVGGGSISVIIVDNDLPLVTVAASDGVAAEPGSNPGRFTITRSGELLPPLVVRYLLTGTATAGVDYDPLPGVVTIPMGQTSVDINVTPRMDPQNEGVETVRLVLSDSPIYNVGNPGAAVVTIQDEALPTVSLTGTDIVAGEGNDTGALEITRTGPTNNLLVVTIKSGGSAIAQSDYAAVGPNIFMEPGVTNVTVTITPFDDQFHETNETVIITLVEGPAYNIGTTASNVITIVENDSGNLPEVSFLQPSSTAFERQGVIQIGVGISAGPVVGKDVLVEWRVVGGSAINEVDYSLIATGYVVFLTNTPIVTNIDLTLLDDTVLESTENVIITLFDPVLIVSNEVVMNMMTNIVIMEFPTNAFLGPFRTHTVLILDDDRNGISVEATNLVARETGPTPSAFRISRTGNLTNPLTVEYAVTGTASSPTDFVPIGNSVVIPANSNAVIIPLMPADDTVEEDPETVTLTLSRAAQAQVDGASQATITIVDNDGTVQFQFDTFEVKENAGPGRVSVQRTGPTNTTVTVDFTTRAGTAIAGTDYVATNGTLVFPPAVIVREFMVPILDDQLVEAAETVSLSLTNPTGGVLLGGQRDATLFIVNDDTAFEFATNSFLAAESSVEALIGVRRLGVTGVTATVTFSTSNLTAEAGIDYRATNVVLNFLPGQTNFLVRLALIDDELVEGNETVQLILSDPGLNTQIGTNTPATLVIADDESVIEFAAAEFTVEEYAEMAAVQVIRRGGSIHTVSVDYQTLAGSATPPGDYLDWVGTLTFAGDQITLKPDGSGLLEFIPGETNKTIFVPIVDDVMGEANEEFSVLLSNAQGPASGSLPGSTMLGLLTETTVTIFDNETPGNVDFEYDPGSGADAAVFSVTVQPDGRTVFGGDFRNVDGVAIARVARLRIDGSFDTSFSPGSGANGTVNAVFSQPDGRILIGGAFTMVDNLTRARIARLTADGAVDPTFQAGSGANNTVRGFTVQPLDDKILVVGDFTQLNGIPRSRVARLNPNGSMDTSFGPVADGPVRAVLVQPDGKIVVAGAFATLNGVPAAGVARVLTNGVIDTSFKIGMGANNTVLALGWQEGKVLVGGRFTSFDGQDRPYLVRLNVDGSLDLTFNTGGSGPNAVVNSLAVLGAGKVVLGGAFTQYNGNERNRFARLRPDGGLDGLFDVGTGADAVVHSVALQVNTAVILGGEFTEIDGIQRTRIARIHGDEFSNIIGVEFSAAEFRVSEGIGKADITVVRTGNTNGAFTVEYQTMDGTAQSVEDYEATMGTLSFAPGEVSQIFEVIIAEDVTVEEDETVVLVLTNMSAGVEFSGVSRALLVIEDNEQAIRFDAAVFEVGEGDTNAVVFIRRTGSASGAASVFFRTMDGTAMAGADYTAVSNTVQFADGESLQMVLVPIIEDAVGEPDETIELVLSNPTGGVQLGLATATILIEDNEQGIGGVDTTFDPGSGANNFVLALAVDRSDRVVVGGGFTSFDGTNRNYLARLNVDGSHDLTFDTGPGANGLVSAVSMLEGGRMIVAGDFSLFGGMAYNRVARLGTNGLADVNFNHVPLFDGSLSVLTLKPDTRLAVGGSFTLPTRGVSQMRIDGTVDPGFDPGAGANAPVHAVLALPNNQLYLGGAFTRFGGFDRLRLTRLLPSGLMDTTFDCTVITNGTVYGLARQLDGKLLVAGDFTASNSTNRARLLRLLETGAVDPSFDPQAGANGTIFAVALQSDGKIIVGGSFTRFAGESRGRYARLHPDGTLDETFDPGTGANNTVYSLVVLPNNNVVIGGDFTVVNGLRRGGVARIRADDQGMDIVSAEYDAGTFSVISSSSAGATYVLEATADFVLWLVVDTQVAAGSTVQLTDGTASGFDQRFYRVRRD